ncbi:hypothetical protein ACFCYI_30295 [Streptomyces sp. NPDC056257]|uniref:hypothetical protein n=1 Tax=Streptomyces sp. NPDC056257 TaxID=3345765 RepID=UPI0035E2BD74
MANSGLWVGVLTALTALGAGWTTARATSRAALAQARTTATAQALREQRDRRRSTYREMMNCAHAFNEVTWQINDVDDEPGRGAWLRTRLASRRSAPCAYQVADARRWLRPPVSRCRR